MPSEPIENRKAIKKVLNALRDLILLKNNGARKTAAQKKKISSGIAALKKEFLRLKGADPDDSYDDAAQHVTKATADLNAIIEERKDLANSLITAAKIVGSLRPVLKLLA